MYKRITVTKLDGNEVDALQRLMFHYPKIDRNLFEIERMMDRLPYVEDLDGPIINQMIDYHRKNGFNNVHRNDVDKVDIF